MHKFVTIVIVSLTLLLTAHQSPAAKRLTIVHTNDLHSHLLGAAPNIAYSPGSIKDDATQGGFARLATIIKQVRQKSSHPVLVVDAGDFLMGSLFHMLSRERAFEIRLMHQMGYDALTLGNHEFDLKPGGLARILRSARQYGQMPPIIASNLIFDPGSQDDDLEEVFNAGLIREYQIIEKDGLRIGIFGLMGKDAAEVAPFADPVQFADPVASAKKWVGILRNEGDVDLVVCLSHSGLDGEPDRSEDEILAREVDGIDVIISGHTHSRMDRALTVNDTIIVQAWEYGKEVGLLDLAIDDNQVRMTEYKVVAIDDAIAGDAQITREIAAYESEISGEVLNSMGLGFKQVIAATDFDLTIDTSESNLGNLITDAIRWDVNRHLSASAKGSDYFLQVSGVRFSYNPHRVIFDRVTDIWLGDEQSGYTRLNYDEGNKTLIGVTADIYNATFLKVIGSFTWQILKIVPKHADGKPIDDLRDARVDADPMQPGIQELKEWQAVMAYIRQMPDSDADGLPDISARYQEPLGRHILAASLNPVDLLKRGSRITWAASAGLILVIAFGASAVLFAWRRLSN